MGNAIISALLYHCQNSCDIIISVKYFINIIHQKISKLEHFLEIEKSGE